MREPPLRIGLEMSLEESLLPLLSLSRSVVFLDLDRFYGGLLGAAARAVVRVIITHTAHANARDDHAPSFIQCVVFLCLSKNSNLLPA